jgi:hypothetical protein
MPKYSILIQVKDGLTRVIDINGQLPEGTYGIYGDESYTSVDISVYQHDLLGKYRVSAQHHQLYTDVQVPRPHFYPGSTIGQITGGLDIGPHDHPGLLVQYDRPHVHKDGTVHESAITGVPGHPISTHNQILKMRYPDDPDPLGTEADHG